MTLVPDRFVVVAVVRDVDADGQVVGEKQSEQVVFFSADALAEWAVEFSDKLRESVEAPAVSR